MRKGKEHKAQGEVFVHLSPRNPVTLNSTFIRFANRPRGKVLGADQRAELRGREEVLIQAKPAGDFVWKRWGAKGLRWGLRCGKEASPLRPAPAGIRRQGAAGGGRAAGPAAASEPRSAPGAQSLRRGRVASPAPSGALSQRGRRAAPRRPHRGLRGRADSPRPRKGCEPARPGGPSPARLHPGGTQPAAVRGR